MLAGLLQRTEQRDNEQLLKLYWNRAGVKRELVALKRERYQLLDKLKEQEGAIVRAQEQLQGLERLLTNPLAAANAMVYFQLRHLWRVTAQRLEQAASELSVRREQRERAQLQDAALAKRERRLAAVQEKIKSLFRKRRNLIEEAGRLERELEQTNLLLRLIRGSRMRRRINALGRGRGVLEQRLEELKELSRKIEMEPLPELEGLSFESRRLINRTLIAFAQELVLHYAEHDLATLAKTAMERTVGDMTFGDRADCDRMVERVRERIEELRTSKNLAHRVKRRADHLTEWLRYRNETDAVPLTESVGEIKPHLEPDAPMVERRATDAPLRVNVLLDDYWDVQSVLR